MRRLLCLVFAVAACDARAAYDLRVGTAVDHVRVVPGVSTDWSVQIANSGDAASPVGAPFRLYVDPLDVPTGYAFSMPAGSCENFAPLQAYPGSFGFEVPSLAPGAAIACTFRVARDASSVSDVMLTIAQQGFDQTSGNSVIRWAGEPVALSIRTEKQRAEVFGDRVRQVVRLGVRNDGPVALEPVQFGHCVGGETSSIELGLPGACLASEEPMTLPCFMGTQGYTTGATLASGQESGCLMRVSERWPLDDVPGLRLGFEPYTPNLRGGWSGILGDAYADLGIGAAELAPRAIPMLGKSAAAMLVVATLVLALLLRQRGRAALSGAARGA